MDAPTIGGGPRVSGEALAQAEPAERADCAAGAGVGVGVGWASVVRSAVAGGIGPGGVVGAGVTA
eukprot:8738690-Alexandrium_andersonii.AAC.1